MDQLGKPSTLEIEKSSNANLSSVEVLEVAVL
jgi:hypothetical protein